MSPQSAHPRTLPFVLVNMAMTADGKIATANRAVSAFGSQRDHDHLLELRSTVDAVMCGSHTAATPGVTMGPGPAKYRRKRLGRGLNEYNLRVIVSGSGRMPPDADVLKHTFSPVVLIASRDADPRRLRQLEAAGCVVKAFGGVNALSQGSRSESLPPRGGEGRTAGLQPAAPSTQRRAEANPTTLGSNGSAAARTPISRERVAAVQDTTQGNEIDLKAALRWLKRAYGVERLLCEGGAELNDAMFRAGLVNEVHLTVCPFVFGGGTAPTIAEGIGFQELSKCARLELKSMKRRTEELFLVYTCLPFKQ